MFRVDSPFGGLIGLEGAGFLFTDMAPPAFEPPDLEPLPDGADSDGDKDDDDEEEEEEPGNGDFDITCPFWSLQIGITEA